MKLILKATDTAADLHTAFNSMFPRLALRVFEKKHEEGEGSPQAERVDADTPLSQWLGDGEHQVELRADMTVAELESAIADLGLAVQVFRRSGDLWLETTRTDGWTLERVNNENF